ASRFLGWPLRCWLGAWIFQARREYVLSPLVIRWSASTLSSRRKLLPPPTQGFPPTSPPRSGVSAMAGLRRGCTTWGGSRKAETEVGSGHESNRSERCPDQERHHAAPPDRRPGWFNPRAHVDAQPHRHLARLHHRGSLCASPGYFS